MGARRTSSTAKRCARRCSPQTAHQAQAQARRAAAAVAQAHNAPALNRLGRGRGHGGRGRAPPPPTSRLAWLSCACAGAGAASAGLRVACGMWHVAWCWPAPSHLLPIHIRLLCSADAAAPGPALASAIGHHPSAIGLRHLTVCRAIARRPPPRPRLVRTHQSLPCPLSPPCAAPHPPPPSPILQRSSCVSSPAPAATPSAHCPSSSPQPRPMHGIRLVVQHSPIRRIHPPLCVLRPLMHLHHASP